MRKLPCTNRLYENLFPEVYDKIKWYKDKSEWLQDFNKCLCISKITPTKIIKTLNLDPKEFKEYSEYLYNSVKILQVQRRKRSIEVRNLQKEDKKTELRNLIYLKNTIHKEWTWNKISDLMNITVRHLRRLRDEIETENQKQYLIDKIETLKFRINKYIETKRQIKEIGYHKINKKELGNINHINKLLNTYNITDIKQFLNILNCNITFILQMSPSKIDKEISSQFSSMKFDCSGWNKKIRPTDPKERKEIIDCWKRNYKILNNLKEKRNILRLIDEYQI